MNLRKLLILLAIVPFASFAQAKDGDPLQLNLGTLSAGTTLVLKRNFFIAANCADCNPFGKDIDTTYGPQKCFFHTPQIEIYSSQIEAGDTLTVESVENNVYGNASRNFIHLKAGALLVCPLPFTIQDFMNSVKDDAVVNIAKPTKVHF